MSEGGADFRQQQELEEQQQFEETLAETVKWFHQQQADFKKIFGEEK